MNAQKNKNGYPIYSLKEVKELNRKWGKDRIINVYQIYKDIDYIVCDIGECDLDGRYCIALPAYTDIEDLYIKQKYNLF